MTTGKTLTRVPSARSTPAVAGRSRTTATRASATSNAGSRSNSQTTTWLTPSSSSRPVASTVGGALADQPRRASHARHTAMPAARAAFCTASSHA